MRTIIAGGPGTGKTTLAKRDYSSTELMHTDDLIGRYDWSDASLEVSYWFDNPGAWTVEGVSTPRALRKWISRNSKGRPCEKVVWLGSPKEPQTAAQERMAKNCQDVWDEVRPELEQRGVKIESRE